MLDTVGDTKMYKTQSCSPALDQSITSISLFKLPNKYRNHRKMRNNGWKLVQWSSLLNSGSFSFLSRYFPVPFTPHLLCPWSHSLKFRLPLLSSPEGMTHSLFFLLPHENLPQNSFWYLILHLFICITLSPILTYTTLTTAKTRQPAVWIMRPYKLKNWQPLGGSIPKFK